jgi:hypothetical protein
MNTSPRDSVFHKLFIVGWDRTATYCCYTGYGLWALHNPPRNATVFPMWLNISFNACLALAGVILMIALVNDSFYLRWVGLLVFLLGMFTVGGLLLVNAHTPVSILVFGLAMQGVISLRNVTAARSVNKELGHIIQNLEERHRKAEDA